MYKFKISKKRIYLVILFIFLYIVIFLPDGIKNMFCLYKMTTSDLPLVYTYNYYFSFFDLIVVIWGLFCYKKSKIIRCMPIVTIIAVINIVRYLIGVSNIVELNSYEMIIMILEAVCWTSILLKYATCEKEIDVIISLFVILTFVTQILQFILGNYSVDGRIAAISLGPGATAEIFIKYELWFLFSYRKKNKSYIPFILSAIGMVLTGSRSNILSLAIIIAIFSLKIWRESQKTKTQNKLAMLYLVLAVGVGGLFISNTSFEFINRFTDLFKNDLTTAILSDSSYFGRIRSIIGGFEIWKDNPMGIACSIYDIEQRSYVQFTMEYPHSALLSYILLWSPIITIPVFLYLIVMLIRLIKFKDSSWVVLGFILLKYLFNSAPILYVSVYSLDIIFFTYFSMRIQKKKKVDGGKV